MMSRFRSLVDPRINCMKFILMQIKKRSSTSSFCDEEIENDANDRKELQSIGAVKFDTYKDFFGAVRSTAKITIVFVMFILAQIAASGSDYFLKEWYVAHANEFFRK